MLRCTSRQQRGNARAAQPPLDAGVIAARTEEAPMIALPGGKFLMGTEDADAFADDGEGPIREIELAPFSIAETTVTNQQFAKFVEASGYRTEAETIGWSFVFYQLLSTEMIATRPQLVVEAPWWCAIPGACWNHPEGHDTDIRERLDHPVVHVSWNDAVAFCRWAGTRLPTEAEWEYAARGGLEQKRFPWGDELQPGGEHRCNIWPGRFSDVDTLEDGYLGTAPARSFAPNGYGLYNMAGNIWEWCQHWFSPDFHRTRPRSNPQGPRYCTRHTRRLLPVPCLLLQPLPRRCALPQYARQLDIEHRIPVRR